MFTTFFKFEIKNWLRTPMLYIFLLIFTLLVFGATASDSVQIGGSVGNVHKNAPFVIIQFYTIMSILTMLLTTAFMNSAAIRDFENNTQQIVFSKPLNKAGYFFGHWAGGILAALIPLIGVSLGILIGSACGVTFGWQDAERFGPTYWLAHLSGYLIFIVPNTLFVGSIIYTISSLTRSTLYSYVATVTLLVAYLATASLVRDIKNENIAALIDPFGIRASGITMKYWTVEEKNTQILSLQGLLLFNRLIWIAVGLIVLGIGYFKFSFSEKSSKIKKSGKILANRVAENKILLPTAAFATIKISPIANNSALVRSQLFSQYKTNLIGIVRSTPFILLSFIGLLNLLPSLFFSNDSYGLSTYPVTYKITDTIAGSFYFLLYSMMTYFAGILIWKERDAKVDEIYDTLPTKTWTNYAAKYLALASMVFIMLVLVMLMGILSQTIKGYTHYEINVYIERIFFIDFPTMLYLLAAYMLIHVLVNNKYIGFFACIVFVILNGFLWSALHISSNMVAFGSLPSATYSALAKFTPFVSSVFNFGMYWFLFCGMLAFVTVAFWVRGKESNFRNRIKTFSTNFNQSRGIAFGLFAVWAACAGWVFYNTKVLNTYKSDKEQENLQVDYEKLYKKYKDAVLPSPSSVKYTIDIFPAERKLIAKGDIFLKNNKRNPIDTLYVTMPDGRLQYQFKIDNITTILADKVHGFYIYKLNTPLAVGDSLTTHFETTYTPKGFENEVSFTKVVQNGTFFNNAEISPLLGYQPDQELRDRNKRKEHGLGEPELMPKLNPNDSASLMKTYLGELDSWTNVETTISTSDDQIAIAPGSLVKDWKENGRHYYNYKLDHASLNFYSFISAKYEVARRKFNGIDLEVYYQKEHYYNVERMLNAMEKSLTYYTANFGPYYHKQCRIIEFPRYASFAQSFPGTMPYSESIGFIADLTHPNDIDEVTFVVAHEMAHQYWAHQVVGANMQGGTLLSETLAQYSAMMVMEKISLEPIALSNEPRARNAVQSSERIAQSASMLRKFLKYDTDNYLRSRGTERLKEQPLERVEASQGYIHYRKGSSVMYYLKEMIGEDKVNLSLRTFLEKFRYKNPPFPTSLDLLAEFKKNIPDSFQYIIKDLFEDITLFSNRTTAATYKKLSDTQYEIKISTESQKFKADERGKETEVPVNDYIEIGALSKTPKDGVAKVLYRQRVKMTQKKNNFTFIVNELPDEAGIDPIYLLIDRVPSDNLKRLDEIK